MKCILIDDDPISRRVIEEYIGRTEQLSLEQSFGNAVDAINFIKKGNDINLIFLDIEMPEMTGIDFLNTLEAPPLVIIISSKEQYAIQAFEYKVTDYLLKPISYARFFKAISKALEENEEHPKSVNTEKEIFIKKNNSLVKISYDDILWVEALENYVVINTKNEKFTIHFTMKSIEGQLPSASFKRVHRSYIVNVRHISTIEDNTILIGEQDSRRIIPIGKSYREKLLNDLNLMSR